MEALYDKEINCPVCKNIFRTKKVRTSSLRIEKKDTDFCTYYVGENPMFYSVFVCPMCGYAAMESEFQNINAAGKKIIESSITKKWTPRSFGEPRTAHEAIEAYKLALICGQLLGAKKGMLGSLCLRLAWLHRYTKSQREKEFLKHTLECFEIAFASETLPIGNLDELSLMYLIGEIHRMLGNYESAIEWFNKAVSNPAIRGRKKLENEVREQWRLAKEENKSQNSVEQVG